MRTVSVIPKPLKPSWSPLHIALLSFDRLQVIMGQSINLQQLCMVRGNCLGPRYCAFALCYRCLQKLPCKDPVMCFPHFQSRNELVKDVAGRAGFSFTDNYALRSTRVYACRVDTYLFLFVRRPPALGARVRLCRFCVLVIPLTLQFGNPRLRHVCPVPLSPPPHSPRRRRHYGFS